MFYLGGRRRREMCLEMFGFYKPDEVLSGLHFILKCKSYWILDDPKFL